MGHAVNFRYLIAAGGLIIVFCLQSFFLARNMSPTFDEPPHIAAGLSYLATRNFRANPQHPPLIKEMSALFAMLGGIRWPDNPETASLFQGPDSTTSQPEWQIGTSIITNNGPDRVLFWARLPMMLLAALLGVVIYSWGRELLGETAALCALLLYAFDPIILAHSSLVTTDVGVAAFSTLFFMALWRYLCSPTNARLLMAGLALGAAMSAKFSAVLLPPLAGVLMLAASSVWSPDDGPVKQRRKLRRQKSKEGPILYERKILGPLLILGAMLGIAAIVIQSVYLFSSNPFLYVKGFQRVNADHDPDYLYFLAGELRPRFLSYFAVGYLLKEPLATILLTLTGAIIWAGRRTVVPLKKAFLFVPPAALFGAYTFKADNIGIRYIIPVLPFAFLLGGVALANLVRSGSIWKRSLAVVAILWIVSAAAGIYPDQMSYFNEAACLLKDYKQTGLDGGSRCGPYWLDDQNVDWGQGTKRLKAWLDQNAPGRKIKWAHFVVFPPAAYGIEAEKIDPLELVQNPPKAGLYVVSGHYVARLTSFSDSFHESAGAWLPRTPPTAVIAHSLYVYDVKP